MRDLRQVLLNGLISPLPMPASHRLTQNNEFARAYSRRFAKTESSISKAEKLATSWLAFVIKKQTMAAMYGI